jgi:actin-related protein
MTAISEATILDTMYRHPGHSINIYILMTLTVDEIQSLVLEMGSHTTRAGYSGDDCPQAVFPTITSSRGTVGMLYDPTQDYHTLTTDPDTRQKVMASAFTRLSVDPKEFPLLLIDNNTSSNGDERQGMAELAFETFNVPALYFGKTAVMAMFGAGRHTGIVVEGGARGTVVVPVLEGIPVNGAVSSGCIGGDYLDRELDLLLSQSHADYYSDITLGHELIKSKQPVGLGEAPKFTRKPGQYQSPTDSFLALCKQAVVRECREGVVQMAESGAHDKELALRPPRYHEFPCGYNKNFGVERFRLGELLFSGNRETGEPGLTQLLSESVQKLGDLNDLSATSNNQILSTLVVAGGLTLTPGYLDRLVQDTKLVPNTLSRVKVQAAGTAMERRNAAWLGGSILASLGSMQSFWMTKQEYMEHGPGLLTRRFP